MNFMRWQFILLICLLNSKTSFAVSLQDLPPDFTASYELFKKGLSVAESRYTFKKQSDKASLTAETNLTGLAALFSNDKVTETSQFVFSGQSVQVSHYSYEQTGKKALSIKSDFDTSKKLIRTTINNDPIILTDFDHTTWDNLSNFILLMSSVHSGTQEIKTRTLDKGKIKLYTLKKNGTREIELYDDNWVKTDIWERQDNRKSVKFYLDPTAHFLPVKIQQYKDGKLRATLLLNTIQWQPKQQSTDND